MQTFLLDIKRQFDPIHGLFLETNVIILALELNAHCDLQKTGI